MSYNGSGTFQINTSGQPVVAGTVISATAFNALTADLATGLSTAITKDGQTTTTARIPFAAGINSTLTTDSSSVSTGSIITAGGVGVAKNLYVGVNANVAGTLGVTGVATFSAAPIYSSLTASSAVATDASKGLVSVTNTGTGNNVLATSPTLVTPILGTPQSGTLTNATGLPLTTGVTGVLPEANGGTGTTTGYYGFKNRIINGDMRIAQRGTSFAGLTNGSGGTYTLDRWVWDESGTSTAVQTVSKDSSAPAGFVNSLKVLTTTAQALLVAGNGYKVGQLIEGFNTADLGWGTANAQTVTLSFWVRSSLTGTFGGFLRNSAADRYYVYSYSINSADTWEYKTVTITGDTTGTWLTNNGAGIEVRFSFGTGSDYLTTPGSWGATRFEAPTGQVNVAGTLNATWFITGVQLEKGSTATSFDYRPYGTELALCQRYYYQTVQTSGSNTSIASGFVNTTTEATGLVTFPVSMRSAPTALVQNGTATDYDINRSGGSITVCSAVPTFNNATVNTATINYTVASGLTAGQAVQLRMRNSTSYLGWSAEL